MPEEQPLETLIPLKLVLKSELIFLVGEFDEVQQLGTGLHDGEGRRYSVIDYDGNAAVWVETEEPFLFLLVGGNIYKSSGPGGAIDVGKLFKHDLDFLAVGRRHGQEVQSFCSLDLGRGLSDVEIV